MPTIAETAEYTAFDDATKGHITSLGFDKLDPMVAVATAASKLAAFGANPDELIRVPKDLSGYDPAPLYDRLGVPKDAAGYQFDAATPADVAERARAVAHELRLTPTQATAYVNRTVADAKASADALTGRQTAAVSAAKGELEATWGAEANVKQFRASKALEAFGWTADTVAGMAGENKDAYVKIMTNMAVLGERMAEARLITGDPATGTGSFTPEQAMAKINALQADPAFRARWMESPDEKVRQAAIQELSDLQSIVVRSRMQPR